MTSTERIYQAACLHIEAFHLELERDGMTLILSDPARKWTCAAALWRGKRRTIMALVMEHVALIQRQELHESAQRDLEQLRGS